jgi:hypothetical protein
MPRSAKRRAQDKAYRAAHAEAIAPTRHTIRAIARVTGLYPPRDRLGLSSLAQPREPGPLPLRAEQGIRPGVQRQPAWSWLLPAATGGEEVPMGMVLAMAAMGWEDPDRAAREGAATAPAAAILHALAATAHASAPQDGGMGREGGASQGGYGQDAGPIEDPLMQPVPHLAHHILPRDFGAASAQRRCATHGAALGALPALPTPLRGIAPLVRVPIPAPLVHAPILVARSVARGDAFEPVPVLSTDRFAAVPVLRGCCHHEGAPRGGMGMLAVQLLYHVSLTPSTPSSAFTAARSLPSLTLEPRRRQASRKLQIPIRSREKSPSAPSFPQGQTPTAAPQETPRALKGAARVADREGIYTTDILAPEGATERRIIMKTIGAIAPSLLALMACWPLCLDARPLCMERHKTSGFQVRLLEPPSPLITLHVGKRPWWHRCLAKTIIS